jgi:hypothetical protein
MLRKQASHTGDVSLMRANVRGIYSTAITKLLLDNGFEIVQPSLAIKKRFELPENSALPDLKIEDRYDLQGVRAFGTSEAVGRLQSILHFTSEDVFTRRWQASVDGIYKGKVVESAENSVLVDIGNEIQGVLPRTEVDNSKSEELVVQVERMRIGAKWPVLTTSLKVVGNYAILARNITVGVSLKIQDISRRTELYALGKSLAPEGWGIIWRESSANKPKEVLENEITMLTARVRLLNEKASNIEAPVLLIEGSYFMDVEFPSLSKSSLDRMRSSVAQTLDKHHFYKSCGGKVSAALEMAEKLLEEGRDRSEVEELFRREVAGEFPEVGSLVDVEHAKPSGHVFHLGQAEIESIDDDHVRYSRIIRRNGLYDGLSRKKEAGDKAVSETKLGQWWITTKYFSESGQCKGTYINMNTPIEVYPDAIRYVDLEVDVVIQPDGTIAILDMEKLDKALEKAFISRKLFEIVKEKTDQIVKANQLNGVQQSEK